MPNFSYTGTDLMGNATQGTIHGPSMDSVVQDLVQRGMTVQSVSRIEEAVVESPSVPVYDYDAPKASVMDPTPKAPEVSARPMVSTHVVGPLVGRVGLPQLSFFFRQLSVLLDAGVNPMDALQTIGPQCTSPKLRSVISELRDHTYAGRPLTAGMQRYPEVFNPMTMSMLRAGEEGGFLASALSQVADYLDREIELRNLLRRVTIYPKLVLAASIVIIFAANQIIKALAPNSPISLSSPLTETATWAILGPILVGLYLFMRLGLNNPRIKYNFDLVLGMIPGFGKTTYQFAMAKFGRALGALYRAGVPISKAFKLSADACGNEALRSKMLTGFRAMDEGAGIAEALRRTGAFNATVMSMVDTGERTGNLDEMLNKLADFYEGEAETRSVQMGWLLGVVALLTVGVYVGYVYIKNLSGITGQYQQAAAQIEESSQESNRKLEESLNGL